MPRPQKSETRRRPIIGVMGSGSQEHAELATPLGIWIAEQGCHLLTGGGGGVMSTAARAFTSVAGRQGLSFGVLPCRPDDPGATPEGYPNPWIEIPIRTHLAARGANGGDPRSRNHVNVLTADVLVVLPGGAGTATELMLAVNYGRPVAVFREALADRAIAPAGCAVVEDVAEATKWITDTLLQRRPA